ncbi:FkbM family methyltransferase [Opitutales bacterium]|nr:FkbM family methyltransferase [Opitutales bacterium]
MTAYTSLKYSKYYLSLLLEHWFSSKTSYSQHGEDSLVESIMASDKLHSFIDIGANDGVLFSNTYKFAKSGARGLCIEPSRKCFRKLKLNHLFHPKVKCLQGAISEQDGFLYLQEDGYEQVLSKVSSNNAPGFYEVKAFSMKSIFNKFPQFSKVDLISIDVEGHEENVLQGCGQIPLNTKIIIIEIDKSNMVDTLKMKCLSNHVAKYSNGVNLILIHKDFKFQSVPKLPLGFYEC